MKFFILAMFIAAFVILPKLAHAGIFSFIENLFGINDTGAKTIISNSQTIPLLEAALNPDMNAAKGGGDITIVNNNALLPNSGPMGTIADIEESKPTQDQISLYVVRKGDNLSQIAEMFGVSVNTIIWANDIKSGGQIAPGQTLIILPVQGIQYAVKKGDSVKSIAKKFNGDVDEIIQFNGLAKDDALTIGQEIIIPNGEDYSSQQKEKTSPVVTYKNNIITNTPSYSGYYLRPIAGGRKSQGLHGYNAVDLADSCGTPIFASANGDVIISKDYGWNAGYGNYIVIRHPNGTQTLYSHLSKNIVWAGWHVVKGQVIGYIGSTGKSTGCHVHFEIRGAKNPF